MKLNTVVFAGNTGAEPRVHVTEKGVKIVTLSIANTEKGKEGYEDKTTWAKVKFFGQAADVAENVRTGTNIVVYGKLSQNDWKLDNGKTLQMLEITGFNIGVIADERKEKTERPAKLVKKPVDFEAENIPF